MSAVVARFARILPRTLGTRTFAVKTTVREDGIDDTIIEELEALYQSRSEPLLGPYESIQANRSVIELWKQQKLAEMNEQPVDMKAFEKEVIKKYSVTPKPNDVDRKDSSDDIRITGTPEMLWSLDLNVPYEEFRRLAKKTLVVKRTVQMTRLGKLPSMYALVVVGNGNGSAGYGEGKANDAAKAVMFATRNAIKAMNHIPRYDDRTIFHDIEHKFKATKLVLWARRPGFGCRVAPIIHEICECIGIQDLAGKIHGSRNPMNVIKTVFEALKTQRVPSDLAKARGLRLIDVNHTYYQGITPTRSGRPKF
ncbi:28S ribosomal protein S5, mitochondrial [Coemansia sp. RSA 1199]|nr:28S ribosomal protein S5, mitochondrial [Coemansia sp. RSA 1199]